MWVVLILSAALAISQSTSPFLAIVQRKIRNLSTVRKEFLVILLVYTALLLKTTLSVMSDTYFVGDSWFHLLLISETLDENGYVEFAVLGLPKGLLSPWVEGHPPGLMFLIGIVSTILGLSIGATYILVLSLMELVLLILTYMIAKRLFEENQVAMVAVALLVVPLYDYRRGAESVATIFIYCAFFLFHKYTTQHQRRDLSLAFLFIILILLTNRTILFFLGFIFPFFAIAYLGRKRQFVGTYIGIVFFLFVLGSSIISFLIYRMKIPPQFLTLFFRESTPADLILPVVFFGILLLTIFLFEKKAIKQKIRGSLALLSLLLIFLVYSEVAERPYASTLLYPEEGGRFFIGVPMVALMTIGFIFYINDQKHREIPYLLLCIPIFGFLLPFFDGYILYSRLTPEWSRMISFLLPFLSMLAAYGLIRTIEKGPQLLFFSLREIKFEHVFAKHSLVKRLIVLLIIFSFIRSIFAAQLYLDKQYTSTDMEGVRWLIGHAEEDSVIMADPWSARVIYGYFGRACWGTPVVYNSPKLDQLKTAVLIFSNISVLEKRTLILENGINFILINTPRLKEYFNREIEFVYMLGRLTALNQIVKEYGEIEVAYEDLRDIPELVEIYNTSGKYQIIVYRVIL
ncbi:MAG: glycosyltransferase family 39 protein [Candidatus Hodarchaeota archaeon]